MYYKIVIFCYIIFNCYSLDSYKLITRKNLITISPFILNNKNILDYNKSPSIVVIGGSGYLGSECVKNLVYKKINVKSVSRNPIKINNINNNYIEYIKADVTNKNSLINIISNSYGVIYCVNPKNKDYNEICINGLLNVASLCILYNIPRLIVISASCISCNNNINKIDKICGLNCEHCKAKQEGEILVKKMYINSNTISKYTFIRSGLLTFDEKRDIEQIEINQDFTKSGLISRIDLAELCINSIFNNNTINTTFETYYKNTIQPVDINKSLSMCISSGHSMEECFFGSYFKNKKPKDLNEVMNAPLKDTIFKTGNEMSGKTWNELFRNLKTDKLI